MPRRTDISSILIVGAGPIVIGQACEFDYSGAQACKALGEEGYRVVLLNSNPATIMTDPGLADATYVEPVTPEIARRVIEAERPDALLATMGGQTALNTALALSRDGTLEEFGVELIGADLAAIEKAEDRLQFRRAMERIGLESPRSRLAGSEEEAREALAEVGLPAILRPSFTLGGAGGGVAYNRAEFEEIARAGAARLAGGHGPGRGVGAGMEGVRDGGGPRPGGQLHRRLLHRERRPDGRAHRRLYHRRPGAHADRQGIPADARRLDRGAARDRRGHRRVERAVRDRPGDRAAGRDRDEPQGLALLRAGVEGDGFPIAKVAARLAVGYTLDELDNDITGATPASFEPTIDYVVAKAPRFTFEKFAGAEARLTTSMKSVGEAMAIGRSFPEALQKVMRSMETGLAGLEGPELPGAEGRRRAGPGDRPRRAVGAGAGTGCCGSRRRSGPAFRSRRRTAPRGSTAGSCAMSRPLSRPRRRRGRTGFRRTVPACCG